MSHINNFKTMLTIAMVVGVALAAPSADKSDQSNEIIQSGSFISKNGDSVSASWGGFHAAASLADDGSAVASAGGNGLGAGAGYGTGGAGAGAGVGFVGASDFASTGGPMKPAVGGYGNSGKPDSHYSGVGAVAGPGVGGNAGGLFDRIFAIPINVLQSVNTYLNQKQMHQGQTGAVHGHHQSSGVASSASASAVSGSATYGSDDKVPVATFVGADYGHESAGAPVHGKAGAPMMIPITALRSVQNLLNG